MPAADPAILLLREWVGKAENDLKNAAHVLKLGAQCPTDTVGFHAQQCVEKYLKALLLWHTVDFPKVHDIERLMDLAPSGLLASWPREEQRRLTNYAVDTRYPGDESVSLSEARQAVRTARKIRTQIRKLLPKAALRKPPAPRQRQK
jgi:HEPN domain-containing protein